MAFGFGFLVGPAIGGYLAQFGYSVPAYLAAGVTLVTIGLTWWLLPETVEKDGEKKISLQIIDARIFKKYVADRVMGMKLLEFFTYILAHVIFTSTFALYARAKLGLETQQVGYVLAGIGLVSIVLRGGLLPKLIDWVGENRLRFTGMSILMMAMVGAAWVNSWVMFLGFAVMFAVGSGLSRPLLMGQISKAAEDEEQGAVMGLASSLGSVAQIVGPMIGGYVLMQFGASSLGLTGAGVMAFGLGLMIWDRRRRNGDR
jgi:DHA1 family tetracycline resistance protein-like MFS transporter